MGLDKKDSLSLQSTYLHKSMNICMVSLFPGLIPKNFNVDLVTNACLYPIGVLEKSLPRPILISCSESIMTATPGTLRPGLVGLWKSNSPNHLGVNPW